MNEVITEQYNLLNRTSTGNGKERHSQTLHYHLDCIDMLSWREMTMLKALVTSHDDIEDDLKKTVLRKVGDSLKGTPRV